MTDAAMLQASMDDPDIQLARLDLTLSKNIADMPGSDEDDPYCLVVCSSGYFDVVSYIYMDGTVRMFTNGDCPRPETDFVAWALLPDIS